MIALALPVAAQDAPELPDETLVYPAHGAGSYAAGVSGVETLSGSLARETRPLSQSEMLSIQGTGAHSHERPLVVCSSSGYRSAITASPLLECGFDRVSHGGIAARESASS